MYFKRLQYLEFVIALLLLLIYGCKSSTVVTPISPLSDLTRSGKFISFTSNRDGGKYNIFLAQVDANGTLVSSGGVFSSNPYDLTQNLTSLNNRQSNWSPNGRILVFSSENIAQLKDLYAYFFAANGRLDSTKSVNPKRLITSNPIPVDWDENPQFSPDGLYLVWDRRIGYDTSARDLYIGSVIYDSSGMSLSNIHPIMYTSVKDEYDPKWSPRISVRRIAYTFAGSITASDHDVWVMDPFDTTNNIDFYEPGKSGYPAWAPECNCIIFESDNGNGGYYKIISLSYPPGGSTTDIVNDASSQTNDRYPTWLPNGNLLAFVKIPDATLKGNIYVISTSGGQSRKLLSADFDPFDNLYPAW